MSPVSFACISPHGWLMLPFIGGPASVKAHSTQLAMQEIGRRLAAAQPETIILITPHGLRVEKSFAIYDSVIVRGATGGSDDPDDSPHSFTLQFLTDRPLGAALAEAAQEAGLPAVRVRQDIPSEPLPLDFAANLPLLFTAAGIYPQPQVLILAADRNEMDWSLFPAFGRAVCQAVSKLGRRAAFIASADLGHAHDPNHDYGYDPASAQFDQAVAAAVRSNNLPGLLSLDPEFVKRAKTDAYGQLLVLGALLEGSSLTPELLSYEVPTYFGMLVASWS